MIAALRRATLVTWPRVGRALLFAALQTACAGARFHTASRSRPAYPKGKPRFIKENGNTWSTATSSSGVIGSSQSRQRPYWKPITASVTPVTDRRRSLSVSIDRPMSTASPSEIRLAPMPAENDVSTIRQRASTSLANVENSAEPATRSTGA